MDDMTSAEMIAELRERAPRFLRDIRNSLNATANELEQAASVEPVGFRKQLRLRAAIVQAENQIRFARSSDGLPGAAAPRFRRKIVDC